jgi:5-methylcytosine-specific restriction protein A
MSRAPAVSAKREFKHLYNSREWREGRIEHLREHPCCKRCDVEGLVTEATIVDHKIPHQGNPELFFDRDNWESMCKPHHDSVKQREEHEQGYR